MPPTAAMTRRHDIDALRALAFALLILYHWGMLYVGGEDWGWHLKSTHLADWLQLPMLLVNRWRMDLIFLVSGLSVHFLLRDLTTPRNDIGRFVALRSWRLLLPLVFGMLVVVPIQPYAQGVANGVVEPGFWRFLGDYLRGRTWPGESFDGADGLTWNHLWYLAYLWVYTLAFAALLPLLRSAVGVRLQRALTGLRGGWLLVLPALPLLVATLTLQPVFGDDGDLENDWYRHAIYFTVFLYGWWIGTDAGLWAELARLRRRALGWALFLFSVYALLVFTTPEVVPYWQETIIRTLRNAYIWTALCAILGWGHVLLDRPFRWLPWANEAVYPWYVLHQSLIVVCAYWLLPMRLGPVLEPLLVLGGTLGGCWLLHEFVIRRSNLLRPCFGMKMGPRRPLGRARGATA
jgi:peptidoglycan/LPS O-acetylase OafA/YrhL